MSRSVRAVLVVAVLCCSAASALAGVGVVWTDLGGGLSGSTTPQLQMSGELTDQEPAQALLTDAVPERRAYLFMGTSVIDAPFMGGVLVPARGLFPPIGVSTFNGAVLLSITVVGLPPGSELYLQMWIQDPGGPAGASATNAWKAQLP